MKSHMTNNMTSNMKKISRNVLGTALTTAFLVSCGGGESTNLADPVRPIATTCTADNCVKGVFVADGVVEGLNYECGNIRSKTNFQGEFSCPLDAAPSKVVFQVSHADTGNKVTLGEYTFRPVFKPATQSTPASYQAVPLLTPDKRVYVTPRELVGDQFSNGFSDRVLSITALLRSLDSDFTTVAASSPAGIVNLTEANKLTFLQGLAASVSSTDAEFRNLVNPGLAAIHPSRQMPATGADMSGYQHIAQQATHAIAAGVYRSFEPVLLAVNPLINFKLLDENFESNLLLFSRASFAGKAHSVAGSGCTAADCYTSFGYMNFGVDRSGRLFGFGTTEMRLAGSPQADPLALSPVTGQKWPNSGNVANLTLRLLNSDVSARPETILMTQGQVDQGSMANDPEVYKDYFGTETSVDARLGRWQLKNGSTTLMGGGGDALTPRMELRHSFNAFPILSPEVWDSDLIADLPLHIKAKISEGCSPEPCTPASVEVNFSILEDGSIISDRDSDCADVDPVTLIDSASSPTPSAQELPIGVITRAFVNDGAGATGGKYLIPLILLPSELVAELEQQQGVTSPVTRQIEIGTSVSARLRVDSGSSKRGEIYDNSSATADSGLIWGDVYMLNKTTGTVTNDPKWGGKITTSLAVCPP